ncbi:MAG: DMT family transporter [Cyanobacteriota bacterium]|nr:DMT family transporter [Cyanobacteriota bacterium]
MIRIPGRAYLLIAVLIFATAASAIRKLTEIGAQHLIDGRNPISFCNILCVGNLCALLILIPLYYREWNRKNLSRLTRSDWMSLCGVALLEGALAPALSFLALSMTMVNNVILIGRIEPPLVLAFSVILFGDRIDRWVIAGAIFSFFGVVLTIVLQPTTGETIAMGNIIALGKGELYALGGALALAASILISKAKLGRISLGIFSIFRTGIGTLIFFGIAVYLFGIEHFADVFSPFVWKWMLFYGMIIVAGGQLCWFIGLKKSSASEVSLASSFNPIAGVLAAYFILGEAPNFAQYAGGSIILIGIVLNQIGATRQRNLEMSRQGESGKIQMDAKVGFKGV